jgi:hypothetical protein
MFTNRARLDYKSIGQPKVLAGTWKISASLGNDLSVGEGAWSYAARLSQLKPRRRLPCPAHRVAADRDGLRELLIQNRHRVSNRGAMLRCCLS